mgnify:CR=1 FL=1
MCNSPPFFWRFVVPLHSSCQMVVNYEWAEIQGAKEIEDWTEPIHYSEIISPNSSFKKSSTRLQPELWQSSNHPGQHGQNQ